MTDFELTVDAERAGERLDAALAGHEQVPSRAAAQRLIDAGAVTVDGKARPRSWRLQQGERVTVEVPDEPPPQHPAPEIAVAWEDEDLIVVDKPAGLVTHPAAGHRGPTLAGALAGRAVGGPDPERAGIVHRLDRDTSGLLIVAKSEPAYTALRRMIRYREVHREYLALVEGHPDAAQGTIDAPLGRDRVRRTVVSTRTDKARGAVTHFEVVERLPRTALLAVLLETGRTHQIRAHLAAIGHPVVGDSRYGGGESGRRLGLSRQFLHSRRVRFRHPMAGEILDCESKPPVDLRHTIDVAKREPVSGGPDGG
jgi:23S rRNA pseudouridine1911/1915/1917 synthase